MSEKQTIDSSQAVVISEYRLLNAIYLDHSILDNTDYSEDLYIHTTCKAIHHAFVDLVKAGVPVTDMSIYNEASKYDMTISKDVIDQVIGINSEPVSTIKDMVDTLKTAKKSLEAIDRLSKIHSVLALNSILTPEIKESLREEFYEAEDLVLSNDEDNFKKALTTKEWTDMYVEAYKKRKDGKQYWFNEPVLDKIVVDGPIPETGGIIAAQSGMGKSTFVLNLVNKLIDSGIPCMYFSLEMGQISTMDRLLAARLQIPYSDIVNPPDSETFYTVYQRILDEKKKLELNKNFRFSENPDISIASLKKEIKKFQNEIGQQYCIVILDLITMVKDFCIGSNSGASLATTIEMAVNKMNALSKELKIHYIGTAQLNRTGESATITDIEDIDKLRPSRHQIKNSGALLERCRYAISLFRRKFYIDQNFPDDPVAQAEDDTIEVQLLKQSNGECKRYYELFNGQCFTVTPLDIEESVEA
jgi:replicative DNA helicase